MNNWRGLKVGDVIFWVGGNNDFDCVAPRKTKAVIEEVFEDHAIAKETDPNGLRLWLDDDTMECFEIEV